MSSRLVISTATHEMEIVVGLGAAGLWRYASGAWTQLHAAGPGVVAVGRLH